MGRYTFFVLVGQGVGEKGSRFPGHGSNQGSGGLRFLCTFLCKALTPPQRGCSLLPLHSEPGPFLTPPPGARARRWLPGTPQGAPALVSRCLRSPCPAAGVPPPGQQGAVRSGSGLRASATACHSLPGGRNLAGRSVSAFAWQRLPRGGRWSTACQPATVYDGCEAGRPGAFRACPCRSMAPRPRGAQGLRPRGCADSTLRPGVARTPPFAQGLRGLHPWLLTAAPSGLKDRGVRLAEASRAACPTTGQRATSCPWEDPQVQSHPPLGVLPR
jgi:hypothetical protein